MAQTVYRSVERVRSRFILTKAANKSKVLNAERVRFEIQGGDYRLIVAFDFGRQVAFIKFLGAHTEYDRIDALTVSKF